MIADRETCDEPSDRRQDLLHMGGRPPATPVKRVVPVLRPVWLRFAWKPPFPLLGAQELTRLDALWRSCGLTGAVIVHPSGVGGAPATPGPPRVDVVDALTCRVPDLCLNVLLRSRGKLLLADMPLLDDHTALDGTVLYADDPRLVAIEQALATTAQADSAALA